MTAPCGACGGGGYIPDDGIIGRCAACSGTGLANAPQTPLAAAVARAGAAAIADGTFGAESTMEHVARDIENRLFPKRSEPLTPEQAQSRRAIRDAKRFGDALTWIERNHPNGIALVARALSETGR